MSDVVTALGGVAWSDGIAEVSEAPLQGMATVRGDLQSTDLITAVTGVASVEMPLPGTIRYADGHGLCWMSPDELLLLCPFDEVATHVISVREALDGKHALVVDVSDARACFDLSGPKSREVLAKLAPVDLSPDAFTQGMFRRTRLAQVPAAFWLRDADGFRIMCFRSHAQYVFDLLCTAAQPGSTVSIF